jgi:hypothetical protein
MKSLFRTLAMMAVPATIIFFLSFISGCEGKRGPAGADGQNSTAVCLECHTAANFDKHEAQYYKSKHYYGTTVARGQGSKYCMRCHTNEGFQEVVGERTFEVRDENPSATKITCETCHKHSGFDFTGTTHADTVAFVMRNIDPVYLLYNNMTHNPSTYAARTTATDLGETNNLCGTCHQIRGRTAVNYVDSTKSTSTKTFDQLPYFPFSTSVIPGDTTTKYKVGTNFSVHDGNQMNILKGMNGYEYPGVSYTKTWQHSSVQCLYCHMNTATDSSGGHTWIVNTVSAPECMTCHSTATDIDDKLTATETAVIALKNQLGDMLVARKMFRKSASGSYSAIPSHDFNGVLFPGVSNSTKYALALVTNNTVGTTTGVLAYSSYVSYGVDTLYTYRSGRPWKYGELGAAYNFGYVSENGIHNPVYAKELLQASINWLTNNP